MAAEIKKIVLQLGKREIELTVDEAKQLFKSLETIFGEKVVREEHHYHRPYWYWHLNTPQWTDQGTGTKWTYKNDIVYCSTGNGALTTTL